MDSFGVGVAMSVCLPCRSHDNCCLNCYSFGPIMCPIDAIDCDVHPTVSGMQALLPYLDDFWREAVEERGINSLETVAYPPNAPLTARPQWRASNGRAAISASELAAQVCDQWHAGVAICNCLYGVSLPFSEDMAAAFTRAYSCRVDFPALHDLARLAELLHRRLCQPHAGLPIAGGEPCL